MASEQSTLGARRDSGFSDNIHDHRKLPASQSSTSYILPTPAASHLEEERQNILAPAYHFVLDGLYKAAIEHPKTVLDVGCGTCAWLVEMAAAHPEAALTGVDIGPVVPANLPGNVTITTADIKTTPLAPNYFDLIVLRFGVPTFNNDALISRLFTALKPGGYLEFQDYDRRFINREGTFTTNPVLQSVAQRWYALWTAFDWREASGKHAALAVKARMEKTGFERVERLEKWTKLTGEDENGRVLVRHLRNCVPWGNIKAGAQREAWSGGRLETELEEWDGVLGQLGRGEMQTGISFVATWGRKPGE